MRQARRWWLSSRLREHAWPWLPVAILLPLDLYEIWVDAGFFASEPAQLSPNTVLTLSALLAVVPLRWRAERPSAVLALVIAGTVLGWAFVREEGGAAGASQWLAMLIAFYSVGAHAERRRGLAVAGATGLVLLGQAIADVVAGYQSFGDYLGTFFFLAAAWVMGNAAGVLRARGRALEGRAARLEREREENARLAVAEERARIARELHDVVAHAVSTMVIQAGGARQLVRSDPGDAERALVAAESTGREALEEMRRLVGLLRERDERLGLAPQPGVGELGQLVEQTREAGLPVELGIEGEPQHLGAGVDLAAYRIVQEALTNVLKHAGPASARVSLRYGSRELEITVTDDGRPAHPDRNGQASGHGLVGMRERAMLYGGTLSVGPGDGGGFHVCVRLPLVPASP